LSIQEGGIISAADLLVKLYEFPDIKALVGEMYKKGGYDSKTEVRYNFTWDKAASL